MSSTVLDTFGLNDRCVYIWHYSLVTTTFKLQLNVFQFWLFSLACDTNLMFPNLCQQQKSCTVTFLRFLSESHGLDTCYKVRLKHLTEVWHLSEYKNIILVSWQIGWIWGKKAKYTSYTRNSLFFVSVATNTSSDSELISGLQCERRLGPVNLLSQSMLVLLWDCKSSIDMRPDRQVTEFSRGLRAFSSSSRLSDPIRGSKRGGKRDERESW